MQQKHKLMHQKQLKEVGSSHKDAPDALLPVHASSGLRCKKNCLTLHAAPIIPKGHVTCHMMLHRNLQK